MLVKGATDGNFTGKTQDIYIFYMGFKITNYKLQPPGASELK